LPTASPLHGLPPWLQKYMNGMPLGMLIGAGLAAAVILIAPIVLVLMRRRKKPAPGDATGDRALPQPGIDAEAAFAGQLANRAASQERLDAEALLSLKMPPPGTKKSEVLTKHLKKAVHADPGVSAQLLRTWIHENDS
jgi:flagellar biosynthesis/type III secretory pathway M-ring protein FliF/YscJ